MRRKTLKYDETRLVVFLIHEKLQLGPIKEPHRSRTILTTKSNEPSLSSAGAYWMRVGVILPVTHLFFHKFTERWHFSQFPSGSSKESMRESLTNKESALARLSQPRPPEREGGCNNGLCFTEARQQLFLKFTFFYKQMKSVAWLVVSARMRSVSFHKSLKNWRALFLEISEVKLENGTRGSQSQYFLWNKKGCKQALSLLFDLKWLCKWAS